VTSSGKVTLRNLSYSFRQNRRQSELAQDWLNPCRRQCFRQGCTSTASRLSSLPRIQATLIKCVLSCLLHSDWSNSTDLRVVRIVLVLGPQNGLDHLPVLSVVRVQVLPIRQHHIPVLVNTNLRTSYGIFR